MTDPIADMLTRIRNGQSRHKEAVECPSSKMRASVLEVLKKEGYIKGFEQKTTKGEVAPNLEIFLKYVKGEGVISEITRVSKPSRRMYSKAKDMPQAYAKLGIFILSTSKGVMSDLEARKQHLGGEILCKVF